MSVAIDEALVRGLLAAQFPDLVGLPVRQVVPGGWDNRTFRIGEDLLARLPAAARYAEQVDPERRALKVLGEADLPAPVPRQIHAGHPGCGYPHPWSIYGWLPGTPAAECDLRGATTFAVQLAAFLKALHRAPTAGAPSSGPGNFHRGGALAVYDSQMRRALAALPDQLRARLTPIWDTALASRWSSTPVWTHGDFAPRNLLVQDGALAGVIDFGQVCAGDPACDLVIAWTYLEGAAREAFRDAIGLDEETWARGRGWAAWKAAILASGVAQGPRPDILAAEAVLRTLVET